MFGMAAFLTSFLFPATKLGIATSSGAVALTSHFIYGDSRRRISRLWTRPKGFPIALWKPSDATKGFSDRPLETFGCDQRAFRSPFGNLRTRSKGFPIALWKPSDATKGFFDRPLEPSDATKGLSDRPLETFGCHLLESLYNDATSATASLDAFA